jgi:hypothetical protein
MKQFDEEWFNLHNELLNDIEVGIDDVEDLKDKVFEAFEK